jgi:hypothetical protein
LRRPPCQCLDYQQVHLDSASIELRALMGYYSTFI